MRMVCSQNSVNIGECDLILSFLCYNDIRAMSRLHRSASQQMSRPAISIQNSGGWTFGSPSVLMMFYRVPGELEQELSEMDECMPHYYRITGNHGQGAETIMRAEAAYMQGRFPGTHGTDSCGVRGGGRKARPQPEHRWEALHRGA